MTQPCIVLGPVVGLRLWAAAVLGAGHGFLMTSALAREQAGVEAIVSPWARLYDHTVPTSNSQESHFLPHPLQNPDEGGREGLWMDVSPVAVGNGFQMYHGTWDKPCDLGQT